MEDDFAESDQMLVCENCKDSLLRNDKDADDKELDDSLESWQEI